jgi:tRNA-dihydrouridine synthase B
MKPPLKVGAKTLSIGALTLDNPFILAPMAGITDAPFRALCQHFGAGLTVSEMISANPDLSFDRKTRLRTLSTGRSQIHAIQILGNDPAQMAEAAKRQADQGAQLIDINMGCPAKKVCKKAAGSALMQDESLVGQILEHVSRAVEVPVTLKIRTGWNLENRNALRIGQIAEQSGIKALTIHGRSRACGFSGSAEYRTIQEVKQALGIPVIANGDITTPEKALEVLQSTGADAVMIGRGALGAPWLFSALNHALNSRPPPEPPKGPALLELMRHHLEALYHHYGWSQGLRVARKHIGWYLDRQSVNPEVVRRFHQQTSTEGQWSVLCEGLESE